MTTYEKLSLKYLAVIAGCQAIMLADEPITTEMFHQVRLTYETLNQEMLKELEQDEAARLLEERIYASRFLMDD